MSGTARQIFDELLGLIQADRIDAAERLCRASLAADPDEVNLLGMLGALLLKKGELEEAEQYLLRTIDLEPSFAKPYEDLGAVYLTRNQPGKAVTFLEKAVSLNRNEPSALQGLLVALQRSGRREEAARLRQRLVASSPQARMLVEADELRKRGETDKAEHICQDILERQPENTAALRLLAVIATEKGNFVVAEGFLRRICKVSPGHVGAMLDLGRFLGDRGRYPEAIEIVQGASRAAGQDPDVDLLLGDMLAIVGRSHEALQAYENCLKSRPDNPSALLGRGHMLRITGRSEDAEESYLRCTQISPDTGDAWWNLTSLHHYSASDEDVSTMRAALDSDDLSAESRVAFHFALARVHEKRRNFEAAWREYSLGNADKRALIKYDPVETELQAHKIKETFNAGIFDQQPAATPTDRTPIFIVGMPRAGSTLVEQILASHSEVEGTGELPYVIMISNALSTRGTTGAAYPEVVGEFDAAQLTGLGRSYLHHAATHCPGDKPYFTDKMPANFSHVGFIHLILPHAKIIDARRDPMATCVANYRQLFAQGKNQSYDLTELGEYYLQYADTMSHWDEVLPGRVLRVQYEDVVADLEAQVRRILDHCGLPFEDACVEFHRSARPVNTASSEQVRQPIYQSAVEFWKHYEPYLDELREVLSPIL